VESSSDRQGVRHRLFRLRARAAGLARRLPGRARFATGLEHGILASVAGVLAYVPTREFGLREGFWAAIAAIAVLQVKLDATRSTARDQFTGAAIGGAIGGLLASTAGQHLWSYALAVAVAVLACWLVNVGSAARLAGTTATIILLVPHQGSALSMVVARVVEVGWGVTVALAVVWAADSVARRLKRPG
jgi:uncharacterized membrane protein YgaE (UPF0421/DUF939 family)